MSDIWCQFPLSFRNAGHNFFFSLQTFEHDDNGHSNLTEISCLRKVQTLRLLRTLSFWKEEIELLLPGTITIFPIGSKVSPMPTLEEKLEGCSPSVSSLEEMIHVLPRSVSTGTASSIGTTRAI
jgi:hypothetical protein